MSAQRPFSVEPVREDLTGPLRDVIRELAAQDAKWGVQSHSPSLWHVILTEEVGEAAEAIIGATFRGPNSDPAARLSQYRQELIQIAAVALQAVAHLDRSGLVRTERDR